MDELLPKHLDRINKFREEFHALLKRCSESYKHGEGEISLIFPPFYDEPPFGRVALHIRSYLLVPDGRDHLIEAFTWDEICDKLDSYIKLLEKEYNMFYRK